MRWEDFEDSHWRRSIEDEIEDITFFHPEEGYFDHGGDMVGGAVAEDIHAINTADGVVAYISEKPQIGTIVELLHAIQNQTPVLALIYEDLSESPRREDDSIEHVEYRTVAPHHWFLINYLQGDDATAGQRIVPDWIQPWDGFDDATVKMTDGNDLRTPVKEWIRTEFGVGV